jgi:hypothetical protein
LELLFKIRFQIVIKFKLDFETKNIFEKWKAMIFERLRQRFGFKLESNLDFDESERFLLELINLKQYINTKINVWRHE